MDDCQSGKEGMQWITTAALGGYGRVCLDAWKSLLTKQHDEERTRLPLQQFTFSE